MLEFINDHGLFGSRQIRRLGLPDKFIEHGSQAELREMLGLDQKGILKTIEEMIK